MSLFNRLSENEIHLLKTIKINIENKNLIKMKCNFHRKWYYKGYFSISSKNGNIQKLNKKYSNIIEKLERKI